MTDVGPVHVLRGHHGEVQSACFLSEELLYTGDSNGELRLWDLASCRSTYAVRLHDTNAGVLHLACLAAYGALVSQGRDGSVRLWAAGRLGGLDRPQPLYEVRTGTFNFCRCAVWAPGDGMLDSAQEAAPRSAAAAEGAPQVSGPQVAPAAQLRDLRIACAASDPADVVVWRPAEAPSAVVHLRQGNAGPKHGMCMSLAFLPECSGPSQARSSAEPSCSEQPSRGGGGGEAGSAADPRFIVTGYEDGVVALWDLRSTGAPLGSLRVHGEPVMCLAVHPRASGGVTGRRGLEETQSGASQSGAVAGAGGGGSGSCVGATAPADANRAQSYDLVSGSADSRISCCVLRPAEAQPLARVKQLSLREAGTADVRIRADGKVFAAGCWDGRTRLYSLRKKEPLAVLKYHRDQVTSLAFSPITSTLATASRDTTVALWSVYPTQAQHAH